MFVVFCLTDYSFIFHNFLSSVICTKWIQITRVQLRVLRSVDRGGSSENDHPGKLGTPNFTSRVLCNWVTSACTYVF